MIIGANGERAEFQTGRKIEPENWDNAKQQAKGKTAEGKLLNAYLSKLRNKVYLKEIELMQRDFLFIYGILENLPANIQIHCTLPMRVFVYHKNSYEI